MWSQRVISSIERERTHATKMKDMFYGVCTHASVQRVVDGDTIDVCFFYFQRPLIARLRLYGINTPELRKKEQREAGLAAKAWLERTLAAHNNVVMVKMYSFGDFGRTLAELFLPKGSQTWSSVEPTPAVEQWERYHVLSSAQDEHDESDMHSLRRSTSPIEIPPRRTRSGSPKRRSISARLSTILTRRPSSARGASDDNVCMFGIDCDDFLNFTPLGCYSVNKQLVAEGHACYYMFDPVWAEQGLT